MTDPVTTGAGASARTEAATAAGQAAGATSSRQFEQGGHKEATDINTEEALSALQALQAGGSKVAADMVFANLKRTYDLHQSIDTRGLVNAASFDQGVNNVALQALQNAVETANMVGKQAVRHGDVAINGQWTLDFVADAVIAKVLAKMAESGIKV